MNIDTTEPTTSLPCPNWCILSAGHGFGFYDDHRRLMRSHEAASNSMSGVGDAGRRSGACSVSVSGSV